MRAANIAAWKVAPLLFGSGLCALVYQIAWLREFRLVFGSSTAASAATLAIFMGGIGAGALLLGRRVDVHPRPLRFYGWLEVGIALFAALTPFLLALVRYAYREIGGTVVAGAIAGTGLRLLLALVVRLADEITLSAPHLGRRMYEALDRPFSVNALNALRREVRLRIASRLEGTEACVHALAPLEPDPLWFGHELELRARCYRTAGHPLARRTEKDLQQFLKYAAR